MQRIRARIALSSGKAKVAFRYLCRMESRRQSYASGQARLTNVNDALAIQYETMRNELHGVTRRRVRAARQAHFLSCSV